MPTRDERTVAMEQANAYGVIRAVLDGLPNFVFVKDREGRYTFVSRSHADAYGRTPGPVWPPTGMPRITFAMTDVTLLLSIRFTPVFLGLKNPGV